MIKSNITDPRNKKIAYIDSGVGDSETPALVVAQRDLKIYNNSPKQFTNPIYGNSMNIDAGYSGTPITIYNENLGTPSEWNVSSLSGSWTFNGTTQVYSGTRSISNLSTGPTEINATIQLSSGTSSKNLTGYIGLTGWIYLTSIPTDMINISGYLSGVLVGNLIDIRNYIITSLLNTWQKFNIPFITLNLTGKTIDSFRISKMDRYSTFYIDYIQIQETGGSISYSIKPNLNTWLYVHGIRMSMVANWAGTLVNNAMPNIPYNSFPGITLNSGITGIRTTNNEIKYTGSFKTLFDLFSQTSAYLKNYGSNGTTTWIVMDFDYATPLILKSEYKDSIIYTINDNMSGFLEFKMNAKCKEEQR